MIISKLTGIVFWHLLTISYHFDHFHHCVDIELLWAELKQVLHNGINSFTYTKDLSKKASASHCKWFTPEIRQELNCIVYTQLEKVESHPTDTNKSKLSGY